MSDYTEILAADPATGYAVGGPGAGIPAWENPLLSGAVMNPMAYGSQPSTISAGAPVTATETASSMVPLSIQLGQEQYNQLPGYAGTLGNIGANVASKRRANCRRAC